MKNYSDEPDDETKGLDFRMYCRTYNYCNNLQSLSKYHYIVFKKVLKRGIFYKCILKDLRTTPNINL